MTGFTGRVTHRARFLVITTKHWWLVVLIASLAFCHVVNVKAHASELSSYERSLAKKPVTVADAIEMTQIYSPAPDDYRSHGGVVEFSPDRSKFAFVTEKGNLDNNTVEFSLLVFRSTDALKSSIPEVVARLASSSNRPAITNVNWLPDNDSIVFLGERPGQTPQVYKVSCRTKTLKRLTDSSTPITMYAVSQSGDRIVYVAPPKLPPALSEDMLQRGFAVTYENWFEIYTDRYSAFDTRMQIYVKTSTMKMAKQVGGVRDLDTWYTVISISPNGRYAMVTAWVNDPPKRWGDYESTILSGSSVTTPCATGKAGSCPRQYLLIDLDNQTIRPLFDAPLLPPNSAGLTLSTWTQRNSVFLVNALLPLNSAKPEEWNQRRAKMFAAEVMLPSKEITEIAERSTPFSAHSIDSDPTANRIVVRAPFVDGGSSLKFQLVGDKWTITQLNPVTRPSSEPIAITLEQSLNLPPTLTATDLRTGKKNLLFNLNPQFAHLTFGHVEEFKWKTKDGHPMAGALYYPPNYVVGKKYPLVIQTHGYTRERFWIDGPYSTAFAAQPLANKSFVVLQMDMGDPDAKGSDQEVEESLSSSKEGPLAVAAYEAAIDELDRRGLIDRDKVGINGFSRTCYHALYALTHSNYAFSAAVIADGVNFGYVNCVFFSGVGDRNDLAPCEKVNGGGPPYGDSLPVWAKAAPTFNLDKIGAPILLQAISSPLGEWEIYAGLKWLEKPVELLNFYPSGDHVLVRPWQRTTSQQTTVDWYCFWLKGEEDPDPTKAEQYTRWRELRKLREANQAQERPR